MESSRRDLFNDMADHSPILKTNQIRTIPVLVSHPKQAQHSPKRGFVFTVPPFVGCIQILAGRVCASDKFQPDRFDGPPFTKRGITDGDRACVVCVHCWGAYRFIFKLVRAQRSYFGSEVEMSVGYPCQIVSVHTDICMKYTEIRMGIRAWKHWQLDTDEHGKFCPTFGKKEIQNFLLGLNPNAPM